MSMFGFLDDIYDDPESNGVEGKTPIVGAWDPRPEGGFVGLSNQGATCYLNTLLQTMFMTSDFRDRLYALTEEDLCVVQYEKDLALKAQQQTEEDGPEATGDIGSEEAIPTKASSPAESTQTTAVAVDSPAMKKPRRILIELQRLFARLQLLDTYAVDTLGMTDVFGWQDGESKTQHDIDELNRILLNVIDSSLQKTADPLLLKQMYCGEQVYRTHCLTCQQNSDRKEAFWDIPIVIKNKYTPNNTDLQASLALAIQAERLDGGNQYRCSMGCDNMKTDALRSVLFLSFPRVLTFTLQRLVFDYETFKRVKNSSEFPFPYELNMNPYLNEDSPDFKESKPLMYDLYSVLIHSGSAHSGHYHAYIRDTNSTVQDETGIDGQGSTWFDFNDSTVSSIPKERIEAQFGGNQECAYMLFYSKREATTTTTTSTANLTATGQQLPAVWLQERMAAENRQLELDREAYLTAQAALSLTVYPHTSLTVVGQEDAKDLNRPARHIVQQQQPQGREAAAGLKIDFDSRKSFGEFAEVLVARCAAAEVELDSVLSQLYEFQQEGLAAELDAFTLSMGAPFYHVLANTAFGKGYVDLFATALRRRKLAQLSKYEAADETRCNQCVVQLEWGATAFLADSSVTLTVATGAMDTTDVLSLPLNCLSVGASDTFVLWNQTQINSTEIQIILEPQVQRIVHCYKLTATTTGEIEDEKFVLEVPPKISFEEFLHTLAIYTDARSADLLNLHIEKRSCVVPLDITEATKKLAIGQLGIKNMCELLVEVRSADVKQQQQAEVVEGLEGSLAHRFFLQKQNRITVSVMCGEWQQDFAANKEDIVSVLKDKAVAAVVAAATAVDTDPDASNWRFRKMVGSDRKGELVLREDAKLYTQEIDTDSLLALEHERLPGEHELDTLLTVVLDLNYGKDVATDSGSDSDADSDAESASAQKKNCVRIAVGQALLVDKKWTVKQCKEVIVAQFKDQIGAYTAADFCLYKGDKTYDEKGKLFQNEFGLMSAQKLDHSDVLWLEQGKLPIKAAVNLHLYSVLEADGDTLMQSVFTLQFSGMSTAEDLKRTLYEHPSGYFGKSAGVPSYSHLRLRKLTRGGDLGGMVPCDKLMLKQQGVTKKEMELCVQVLPFEEKGLTKNAFMMQHTRITKLGVYTAESTGTIAATFAKAHVDHCIFDGSSVPQLETALRKAAGADCKETSGDVFVLKWFHSERKWRVLYEDGSFFPEMSTGQSFQHQGGKNKKKQKKRKKVSSIAHKPYAVSDQSVVALLPVELVQAKFGDNVAAVRVEPVAAAPKPAAVVVVPAEWACPACTLTNAAQARSCSVCGTPNPSPPAHKQKKKGKKPKHRPVVITMGSRWDRLIARLQPPPGVPAVTKQRKNESLEDTRNRAKGNDRNGAEESLSIQFDD